MFLDEAVVEFASGRGGNGAASFHREKHVPRGGPNGEDGGRGGDVVLVADGHMRTLYDFKLNRKFLAENGVDAVGNKSGRNGKSIEVKVPVGTVVTDTETGDVLVDLSSDGMKYVLCRGGKGGFGNLHYTNSVRQVPTFAQKGAPGESVVAKLELKLLADVGLVGLPNAGKSTLISRVSAAKPKIADYPFTTIVPNLGVVSYRDTSFTIADMPGLIEGASQGRGLGHQFLKHVERTRVLVHVVDVYPIDESEPLANYELIEAELKSYSEEIWSRPRLVALNKIDVLPEEDLKPIVERFSAVGHPVYAISAVSGQGMEPLLAEIVRVLEENPVPATIPVLMPGKRDEADEFWDVVRDGDRYRVIGKRIERMIAMTNLDNEEAVRYLHRRLKRIGVIEKLRDLGVEEDDTVFIGGMEFNYSDEL